MVNYEDAPLRFFHVRTAVATTGGVFADGFGLGIIGIALSSATQQLSLTPLSLGLVGGSSLAGLFFGALLTGPVADRFGRRRIFAYNMALLALCSLLQFMVGSVAELLILRVVIGLLLGTDYVVSKALLTEFAPRLYRGRMLSGLSIAWASGYACAYFTGYALNDYGSEPWRWMLVSSSVPALLVLPFRLTTPESPPWLANHGRPDLALRVVRATLGNDILPPATSPDTTVAAGRWRDLFAPALRRRTLVGCTFFTCQVIPYFAVGTFVGEVTAALNINRGYLGGLVYNALLLAGAILGLFLVDRISRRSFMLGTLGIASVMIFALAFSTGLPIPGTVAMLAVFAGSLSAASSMVYAYLPELFPTELRASGIGLAIASSRIGSAVSTFLLPIVVVEAGIRVALVACGSILAIGVVVCLLFAPETRNVRLSGTESDRA